MKSLLLGTAVLAAVVLAALPHPSVRKCKARSGLRRE
jgi:hypothetical protein